MTIRTGDLELNCAEVTLGSGTAKVWPPELATALVKRRELRGRYYRHLWNPERRPAKRPEHSFGDPHAELQSQCKAGYVP